MIKREKLIMNVAVEIDRLLTDGIEIHPNSPIHEKLNQALHQLVVSKRFLVTYRYTNRTDAALHEDEIEARNCVEACNKVCSNHNYEVEWHTVKEVS